MSETRDWLRSVLAAELSESSTDLAAPILHRKLLEFEGSCGSAEEGFELRSADPKQVHPFRWGHTLQVAGLRLEGALGEGHLRVVEGFLDLGLQRDFRGIRLLDVGVWTGATSFLYCALGARVVAVEEVPRYAAAVDEIARAFGLPLCCYGRSLFGMDSGTYRPTETSFDFVSFPGVVYHVSDPLVALRTLWDFLRPGGRIFVESAANSLRGAVATYGVNEAVPSRLALNEGRRRFVERTGTNYFVPSPDCLVAWLLDAGFEDVEIRNEGSPRIFARATRPIELRPMVRAGLSRGVP